MLSYRPLFKNQTSSESKFYSSRLKGWTKTPSMKSIQSVKLKRLDLLIKQQHLPEFETHTYCEGCEKYVETRIRYKNGVLVYLLCFIL